MPCGGLHRRRPCRLCGQGNVAVVPGIALAGGSAAGSWIETHYAVKKGDHIIRICLNVALAALVIKLLLSRA